MSDGKATIKRIVNGLSEARDEANKAIESNDRDQQLKTILRILILVAETIEVDGRAALDE